MDRAKRLRCLSWNDYGISKERYRELKFFCLQYKEKKKQAAAIGEYGPRGGESSGGTSGGFVSKPTEEAAIKNVMKRERLLQDIRIIEEAAMRAANVSGYTRAWRLILRSVTEDIGFDRISLLYSFVPYTKTDFAAVRRVFFHYLDELQDEPESPENTGFSGPQKVGAN